MNNILYLASQSKSRQHLLQQAKIPYTMISHTANEHACDWNQPFQTLLETIACFKMQYVEVPPAQKDAIAFVLTADTMGYDSKGVIHGKPENKADAIKKLKALSGKGTCGTGFCLDRKIFTGKFWVTQERIVKVVCADYFLDIPDSYIERYLHAIPDYLTISGALTIEDFGAQFVKSIQGSYTTILGLPMFELREALQEVGFLY